MYYANIVTIRLTRGLKEPELVNLIEDLNGFRTKSRVSGKLRGMPNHIFNIYDETDYDEVNDIFIGELRLYYETEGREDIDVADVATICSHNSAVLSSLVRKWVFAQ